MAGSARDLAWPDLIWSHFSRSRFGEFDERVRRRRRRASPGSGCTRPSTSACADEEGRSPADIRAQVEDHGLVIGEIEAVKGWSSPPGPEADACRKMEDLAYEMADEFGCRYFQAVAPAEGDPAELGPAFAALCDRAAAHGLLVGIEFLPFTCVEDAADAKVLIDAADRPNAGCCVDIWHHTRGAARRGADPGADRRADHGRADERRAAAPRRSTTTTPTAWPPGCRPARASSTAPASSACSPTSACGRRSRSRSARPSCGPDRPTRRRGGRPTGCARCWPRRPPARDVR